MMFVIVLLVTVVAFLYKLSQRPTNFPPGLPKLPILGSLPFLGPNPFEVIKRLTKKHGEIFSFFLGHIPIIVIADYDLYKEAMADDSFVDRASLGANDEFFLPDKNGNLRGIMFSNGQTWIEQRRFSHRLVIYLKFDLP